MSKRNRRSDVGNNNHSREVELKLNICPPPPPRVSTSSSSPEVSPPRSCVSSEESTKYSSSPETMSMLLVGCPRCLMYVMLSEADPRCPKCKSTALVDLLRHNDGENCGGSGGGSSNSRRIN